MRFLSGLSPKAVGMVSAVITVTIWTSFIVIARASAQRSLGPLDLAFTRILGASLILLPWGWWLVRSGQLQGWLGLSPLSFRLTALTGLFGGLLYAMLSYSGFFYAPASHASVLLPGSLPLWTALLAAVILKDRITPTRAAGLVLIVAGDLLVGGTSLLQAFSGGEVWKGDVLFMTAALCWSVYSVLARRHALGAVQATIAITVFAFVTYVPVYLLLHATGVISPRVLQAPVAELLFQVVYQGVGSVVIAGISFTAMIRYFGPVRSTMITALVPGLSALCAVVFLGEPMHWHLLAGLGLVTSGILFGVRTAKPLAKPELATNNIASHAMTERPTP